MSIKKWSSIIELHRFVLCDGSCCVVVFCCCSFQRLALIYLFYFRKCFSKKKKGGIYIYIIYICVFKKNKERSFFGPYISENISLRELLAATARSTVVSWSTFDGILFPLFFSHVFVASLCIWGVVATRRAYHAIALYCTASGSRSRHSYPYALAAQSRSKRCQSDRTHWKWENIVLLDPNGSVYRRREERSG